ncbi:FAD-dependent oxidoreductase [Streptomyces sp. NPDC058625]|uniref:FAD-dependent oxidoreductase n=1 Tax=Streptomyces sp. NPDC058625 TaxID=3346564 RepID=UPI00365A6FE9
MSRVVVVGASAAGLAAAEALRRAGHDGPLALIGDEPRAPYDRPPLSKQILSGAWPAGRLPLRRDEDLDALDLDLRLGTAATGPAASRRTVALITQETHVFAGPLADGLRPAELDATGYVPPRDPRQPR